MLVSMYADLLMSQVRISATSGKLGVLKFSIEMRRGYPNALIISVKSVDVYILNSAHHQN